MQTAAEEKKTDDSNTALSGKRAAHIFKYFIQFNKSYVRPTSFNRISAKGFYDKHKTAFDSLAAIFSKYSLDMTAYIKYFVIELGKTERDIDEHLVSKLMINSYAAYLSVIDKRRGIYKSVMRTVKNLSDLCADEHLFSAKECIRWLIQEKKLGQYVMGGVISKYFLAGIPKFDKIVPKLDYFSKAELSDLVTRYDIYNTDVNEAFMYVKNTMLNPLKLLDTSLSSIS